MGPRLLAIAHLNLSTTVSITSVGLGIMWTLHKYAEYLGEYIKDIANYNQSLEPHGLVMGIVRVECYIVVILIMRWWGIISTKICARLDIKKFWVALNRDWNQQKMLWPLHYLWEAGCWGSWQCVQKDFFHLLTFCGLISMNQNTYSESMKFMHHKTFYALW